METPSPFTPLGSKGVGEGNCMSTPVCIANAVADALGLKDVELPLVPAKLADTVRGAEPPPPARRRTVAPRAAKGGRQLTPEHAGTVVRYEYDAAIGGKVASIGGRLLDGAARIIIGQFFAGLARQAGGASAARPSPLRKFSSLFGGRS
jgi:hypothetical protein